jgi:hypothetical protein
MLKYLISKIFFGFSFTENCININLEKEIYLYLFLKIHYILLLIINKKK